MTTTNMDKKETVTKPNYNGFIKGLDIKNIRLVSATIENMDCNYFPSSAVVKWRMAANFENKDGEINVFHRYNVRVLEQGKEVKAKMAMKFCVTYNSQAPMTEELFKRFKDSNLPINTWPYFREFVHSIISRMGWPPFIAPTFIRQIAAT